MASFVDISSQAVDFVAVEQQFAFALGVVVKLVALCIFADVRVVQIRFSVLNTRVAIFQIGAAFAQGFDFCAPQLQAGFIGAEDVVVAPRFSVLRDDFDAF